MDKITNVEWHHSGAVYNKIKVSLTALVIFLLLVAVPARAQNPSDSSPADSDSSRPFEISDNSFLVEEALNQESGVFQNIFNVQLDHRDEWVATFTQEWPVVVRAHQLSFTLPYASIGPTTGVGDAAIHYRLQLMNEDTSWAAFSPRVSLIVPSGRSGAGLGRGHPGWEVNLPFSRQVRDFYFHWNAGFTHFPIVDSDTTRNSLWIPRVAASGIWRVRPMVNLMLESLAERIESEEAPTGHHITRFVLIPGIRTGWNFGDAQTIIGAGIPIAFSEGSHRTGIFLYLSHELPFTHPR